MYKVSYKFVFLQMVKRVEKARKKAETVTDSVDISDKAKMKQVQE